MTPGLGAVSLPARRLQWIGLQTVYAPAHHQSQPQGPALLPGERQGDQPLTAALQRLPQIAAALKRRQSRTRGSNIPAGTPFDQPQRVEN